MQMMRSMIMTISRSVFSPFRTRLADAQRARAARSKLRGGRRYRGRRRARPIVVRAFLTTQVRRNTASI